METADLLGWWVHAWPRARVLDQIGMPVLARPRDLLRSSGSFVI
jgi:carbamoylphosphate synthase large subunit